MLSNGKSPIPKDRTPIGRRFLSYLAGHATAWAIDGAMCATMYAIQRRHRLNSESKAALACYISECKGLSRSDYFAVTPPEALIAEANGAAGRVTWQSPIRTAFPKNDRVHVDLFPCAQGWKAPTVLLLHSLMSTSDTGYRQWAARFNRNGWNACFIHLPFHYSRTPPNHFNGELAITADLIRTAEGLRQGVSELRQLMALLRTWGCTRFGMWASSYGGWIGALLASVEVDFRFVILMEPIVDVEHAIWKSPAGAALRVELRACEIDHAVVEHHFHLTSPLHGEPLCEPGEVLLVAGEYDRVAPATQIAQLHAKWNGSMLLHVPQGHFGYKMMPTAWQWLREQNIIESKAK